MSLVSVTITAQFDGALGEAVYSGGSFHSPYSDDSTVTPVTGGYHLELIRAGGWPGTTVELTIDALDSDGTHAVETITWNLPEPIMLGTGGLDELQLSWVAPSQIRIAAGVARSDDDTADIRVASTLTVDLMVSSAGGLDAASEAASTWYSVWVISDTDGALPVAGLVSTSAASPTLPTGYDHRRRVGWVRNDGSSNLLHFYQRGNGRTRRIQYDEARTVLNVLKHSHRHQTEKSTHRDPLSCYLASGSGRSWKRTALLVCPLPPSSCQACSCRCPSVAVRKRRTVYAA